jgi:predicted aldo/keto reductase-like oxidoreductase
MSNFEQMRENIGFFEENKPLSDEEMATILGIAKDMTSKGTQPCTACRYCTTHCPMELNIPWLIELYNEHVYSDGGFIAPMALSAFAEDKLPSACIGCKSCEEVCPQNIEISEMMSDFSEKLK